jgi:hypothetical protein
MKYVPLFILMFLLGTLFGMIEKRSKAPDLTRMFSDVEQSAFLYGQLKQALVVGTFPPELVCSLKRDIEAATIREYVPLKDDPYMGELNKACPKQSVK